MLRIQVCEVGLPKFFSVKSAKKYDKSVQNIAMNDTTCVEAAKNVTSQRSL